MKALTHMRLLTGTVVSLSIFLFTPVLHAQTDLSMLRPHHATVVTWSADSNYFATGHVDGYVRVFDRNVQMIRRFRAHNAAITTIAFSPDATRVATGGKSTYAASIWHVEEARLLARFENIGHVLKIDWTPDGEMIRIITGNGQDTIVLADIAEDTYVVSGNGRIASSDDVSWNPDHSVIAYSGVGSNIILVDPSEYEVIRRLDSTPDTSFLEPPNEYSTSITWHPTDNLVADGKVNGWIHVWDLASPSDNIPVLNLEANDNATDSAVIPFDYAVKDIIFTGSGRHLLSVSAEGTLRAWDIPTGTLRLDRNMGTSALSAAF
ncbi:MAG: hypothetical protein AAGK74_18615, partial [Chloroflexota bacterium]